MPVETEHAAESLEPVGIGEAAQHFRRAELAHQKDDDFPREQHHALEKPARSFAAMQRQMREPGPSHQSTTVDARTKRTPRARSRGISSMSTFTVTG